ncbi:MAG: hypothetical protein D6760_05445 [Deltaproteobacteria bacterium]|nr:MAG: hypothetical protein D6760_05445 [Deltaproteobacteria bacterium]
MPETSRAFAAAPVFVGGAHVERMKAVIDAVERVVRLPAWRSLVLSQVPPIAGRREPALGVFYGYDFHIGPEGPQLIEINTNAGGALLNVVLGRAVRSCCDAVARLHGGPFGTARLESVFVEMFRAEWRRVRGDTPLTTVAIVDDDPESQFLYPEMVLCRAMLGRAGIGAGVVDAARLEFDGERLLVGSGEWPRSDRRSGSARQAIDLVYNRTTDFYLEAPEHEALRAAYEAGAVVVTPHPVGHALYARKTNLVWLSDPGVLREAGADEETIATLEAGVPKAIVVSPAEADRLWRERRRYFFKPVAGFGGKAAYRGDKLTRKTFERILTQPYIAQHVVPPSEREIETADGLRPLKFDVRAYVYDGEIQLLGARMYRGQTTNFRTAGGGFAPVYTDAFSGRA